ncbi:hypothetical protein [Methylobacterium brachiatum]|jgi:hypothetical protein|uniref:hypothetical protein n=1 Tax=Methylobacterium brachiatum TaxID=269660 RepID=UPI000EFD2C48|nr:hypothetical protein [Methylobacterium brachiatum]AYO81584.1 hypothetical protein EBB05_04375 [Methylobacterium brachiatum]
MQFGDDVGAGEAFASESASAGGSIADHTPQDTPAVEAVPVRGATLAARIDNLHADMLGGTALGNHTGLWNLVHAFKERVKALVAEIERAAS